MAACSMQRAALFRRMSQEEKMTGLVIGNGEKKKRTTATLRMTIFQ